MLLISINTEPVCIAYRINNLRTQQLGVLKCFFLFHDLNNYTFLDGNFYRLINPFSPCICHFLKKFLVAGCFLLMIKRHLGDESVGVISVSALTSIVSPKVKHG